MSDAASPENTMPPENTLPPENTMPEAESETVSEPVKESAVSDPAKLIRLGTMLQALMAEVRAADTDEPSRMMLARIHDETKEELATVLSPDLMEELSEFSACCDDDGVPTEAEIRIAQAQLVGWLQGLLQGLQASMVAQQAAATSQLRELASGRAAGAGPGGVARPEPSSPPEHRGTYL